MRRLRQETPRSEHGYVARNVAAEGCGGHRGSRLLSIRQLEAVIEAGVQYIVTPGFSPDIVRRCQELSMPVFPSAATAPDLHAAVDHRLDAVKFFPTGAARRPGHAECARAPFSEIKFIPTGDINPANAAGHLRHPAVLAVGGSWIVAPHLIRSGDSRGDHQADRAGGSESARFPRVRTMTGRYVWRRSRA
ncbi:MAG TPA: hypothetical protein VF070_05365 [Streptosporangiaceae bacterium]